MEVAVKSHHEYRRWQTVFCNAVYAGLQQLNSIAIGEIIFTEVLHL